MSNATVMSSNLRLDDILKLAVDSGASDIHLSTNSTPRFRIDGDLLPFHDLGLIENDWLRSQIQNSAPVHTWQEYCDTMEADFAHSIDGYGRFRFNAMIQKESAAAVLRTIPSKIKTIEELGAPQILENLTKLPNGLILVTGPTGSGKSTTLAAMVESRNLNFTDHIVTIEDPIEFVYESKKCLINQREVGRDTQSFQSALKRVLRQDPDVILLGELRDSETISTALTAAETGHLVLGTLHTNSASKTIDRIIDSFPSHQQNQVRSQLSDTLQAVISQNLVKKIGGGRVAATEILTRTNAISSLIREGNVSQIYSAIQTGRSHGMHTLDFDLKKLVNSGMVDPEEVKHLVVDKTSFDSVSGKTSGWG